MLTAQKDVFEMRDRFLRVDASVSSVAAGAEEVPSRQVPRSDSQWFASQRYRGAHDERRAIGGADERARERNGAGVSGNVQRGRARQRSGLPESASGRC
jgi:hypothetical protein